MNLLRRLEQTHKVVSSVRFTLPSVAEADEVFAAYELAHTSIEQFMHNTHNEWFNTIEPSLSKELQANLLVTDKAAGERSQPTRQAWATRRAPLRHVHGSIGDHGKDATCMQQR